MDTETLAHSAPSAKTTRIERGIALGIERFEEIRRIGPWEWEVPSCTGTGSYRVNLKTETCPCPDRTPADETDKHVVAAKYKKARTAICVGCGGRFRHTDLFGVGEDSLTFFEGDVVCRECASAAGVL